MASLGISVEINTKTKLVWRLEKGEDQALISKSTILKFSALIYIIIFIFSFVFGKGYSALKDKRMKIKISDI